MRRREFLRATGTAAAMFACGRVRAAGKQRMNLLIIHTDEHNFRTLGCYRKLMPKSQAQMWGPHVLATPNIDRIAAEGAVCTRFYATTPVCSPSRAAFVSGRYPQNTPVTTNNIPLADDVVTFAEILRRAGWATGYAGKWHLDGAGKPQWAPKRKFGFQDNRYMYNRGHWKQLEETPSGPRVKARSGNRPTYAVAGADEKSFTTDFLADRTVEFIRAHRGEPFCFMVSIPDPHGPNTVRPPYDTMFTSWKFQPPPTMSKPDAGVPSWAKPQRRKWYDRLLALYYGMVKCIDDNVGKILKALDAEGLADRTIVVFTADHGDLCGEHGRDNKGVPLEGSAKIPFVIRCPGKISPGTVVKQALGCVDFLPTVLSLMGVRTAGTEQGRDASALLMGRTPAGWDDVTFFRGTGSAAGSVNWLAAVTSRYKLVFSPRDEPWLIDLEKDPDELKNLLRDPAHREILRTLARKVREYCEKYNDPYARSPRIRADIAWACGPAAAYTPPALPAAGAAEKPAAPRRKRRRKAPAEK